MTDMLEQMKLRRSVRKFEDKAVPRDVLEQILEAARWAQSWANTQCWDIVVVDDTETKARLRDTVPEGNPGRRAVDCAPVVLAICGKCGASGFYKDIGTKFGDWMLFDLGIATQNMALAAHNLGLGSVVLGLFDHDTAKTALDVPEGHELVALMALGYPAKDPSAPPRKKLSEFVHYNNWRNSI